MAVNGDNSTMTTTSGFPGGKFHVKLVPTNCHRGEVIFEIISALDHLNSITNEMFSSIRLRITHQQLQMSSISSQLTKAAERVAQMRANQKPIRVLSAAKFPENQSNGIDELKAFPMLELKNLPPQKKITDDEEILIRIKSQRNKYESPIKNPEELLQYYRVRDQNHFRNLDLTHLENIYEAGLGLPPKQLKEIDSFFLFNTTRNPYRNYKVIERPGRPEIKAIRKGEDVLADLNMNASKDSDDNQNKPGLDDFYYYPSTVQIPDIDVPDHLPDLPGIADTLDLGPMDLTFSLFPNRPTSLPTSSSWNFGSATSTSTPITPMNTLFDSTPSKPPEESVQKPSPMSGDFQSVQVTPDVRSSTTSNVPPGQGGLVIPPPPPPPVVFSGGIPPPPPPPPAPLYEQPEEKPVKAPTIKPPSGGVDVRSNLMAAIREAGGSGKLRSAKDRKSDAKKKKQEEKEKAVSQSGGTDMMADLKNTLAMRRRGISGMQDNQRQVGLGDIMQKISSSIPHVEDSIDSVKADVSEEEDWD